MRPLKKIFFFCLTFCIGFVSIPLFHVFAYYVSDTATSHYTGETYQFFCDVMPGMGVVEVSSTDGEHDILFELNKDGIPYQYRVAAGETSRLPLNMGSGEYLLSASVYANDTQVELLWKSRFEVLFENERTPFLSSSRIVDWHDTRVAQIAKELKAETPEKTVNAFATHIISQFTYYYAGLNSDYIPNLDKVYDAKKGVCYDFAAVLTAMCRSVGIPCKLAMGYTTWMGPDKYHAWCMIYLNGEWVTADPTYGIERGTVFMTSAWYSITKVY